MLRWLAKTGKRNLNSQSRVGRFAHLTAAVALCGAPAHAWDHTIGAVCTLWHQTETAEIRLTYDPAKPLYTLRVTRTAPWPHSPWFGMRFDGPQPNVISTTRHTISGDGTEMFVADVGFGNVLDGLQFNTSAYALTEGEFAAFPLDGAAPHVQAFRDCAPDAGV